MPEQFIKRNYLIEVDLEKGYRRYLNSLFLSLVDLDEYHVHLINNCGDQMIYSDNDLAILHDLKDLGIVRYQDENEYDEVCSYIESWRSTNFLSVAMCLTFGCNFKCVYCYERPNLIGYDMVQTMSPSIAMASLDWMKQVMDSKGMHSLKLTLFGGEPLLCKSLIYEILEKANSLFEDFSFDLYMSTNGYLLDQETTYNLINYGLRSYQVTIDGTPSIHNKRRPLTSGKESFERIVENVVNSLNLGIEQIKLLTVCDSENIDDVIPLIDHFITILPHDQRKRIEWNFSLVEPTETCIDRSKLLLFGQENDLAEKIINAREYASSLGFKILFPYSSNICGRQMDYFFGIGPTGELYSCFGTLGNKDDAIGNIFDPFETVEKKSKEIARLKRHDKKCHSCEVFPICRGARCYHKASTLLGRDSTGKHCEKEFLIQDIERNMKSSFVEYSLIN